MLEFLKITVLMADLKTEQKALTTGQGMAYCIESELKRMFFDFGATSATLKNAKRLDTVMGPVDYAILSIGSWDHGSGYPAFVKDGLKVGLYAGPHCFFRKYKKDGIKYSDRGLSFSRFFLDRSGRDLHEVEGLVKIAKGINVLQGFELNNDFEVPPQGFYKELHGDIMVDDFQDEIVMVFETPGGLVVLISEALRGLINILDTVQQTFNQPIRAVVTGLRPEALQGERFERTIEALKDFRLETFACHTVLTEQQLAAFGKVADNVAQLGVGDCLMFR